MTEDGFAYKSSQVELDALVAYGRVLERERIVNILHERYRFWSDTADSFDNQNLGDDYDTSELSSLYRQQADLFDAVIAWVKLGAMGETGVELGASVTDFDTKGETL